MTATQWQSHLISQGAHFDDGAIMHFGNSAQELVETAQSNILCDLSHYSLLEVNGADAVNFLQGQLTNDVRLLDGTHAHYSGYCSPKGRLLALFLAFAHQQHLHLQLPASIAEPIIKRLRMFVMRSKVTINETSERIVKLGINGPNAAHILQKQFSQLPTKPYSLVTLDQATLLQLPALDGHTRYEMFTAVEHAPALWNALKQETTPAGKPCWDWLEVNIGIPEIIATTQEQFVPQMVNLDLLNAIHFKKGCYTGQEIVARTHYLGSVKRRTFLMHLSATSVPLAGDKLVDGSGNEIGQVVRVAPDARASGFDMLAELRIEAQQSGNVYWQTHALKQKALPYSLGLTED